MIPDTMFSHAGVLEQLQDVRDESVRAFEDEISGAYESVLDVALEAHTISKQVRDKLPDSCFGVIEKNEDGTKKRSYPLAVPGDKAKTDELITKAVQFFHYCKPERREALAKNIMKTIRKYGVQISISEGSQIFNHVKKTNLPPTVTLVPRKSKKK